MVHTITILDPSGIVPGTIDPTGRVVKSCWLYENPDAGVLVAEIRFEDGTIDARMWPLAANWMTKRENDALQSKSV